LVAKGREQEEGRVYGQTRVEPMRIAVNGNVKREHLSGPSRGKMGMV
jgi:hypothetical protein